MNNQEIKQKKPFYKKWWVWVLAVFVLFIIIGSSGDSPTATSEVTESNESPAIREEVANDVENADEQEKTVTETTTPAPQAKSYQEVFTFSGNGNKKSEPFTITGGRFKVKYDCAGEPDFTLCQAFVYKVGSSLPEVIMNTDKATKDETIIYGSGEYYIDANTIGNYTMVVEDYR